MDITGIGSGTPVVSTSSSSAAKTADVDAASSATPSKDTDTVTLSPVAQQAVANSAVVAPTLAETLAAKAAATKDSGQAQFYTLASTVVDASGKYTPDQQFEAYLNLNAASFDAHWQETLPDFLDVYNAVTKDSAIGKKINSLADTFNAAAMRATQSSATNNDQGVAQAQCDAVTAMSDFDRKVLFRSNIGVHNSGCKDADQWLAALQTKASGSTNANTSTTSASTPFQQNATKIYGLAAIITDTSGKYTQDQQLAAYNEFQKGRVFGQFMGGDGTTEKLGHQVGFECPFGRMVQDTCNKASAPAIAAFTLGDPNSHHRVLQAALDAFNSLSDFEKKVYFQTNQNAQLLTGQPYSSMQDFVDQLTAAANGSAPTSPADSASETAHASPAQKSDAPTATASGDPVTAYAKKVAADSFNAKSYLAQLKLLFDVDGEADKLAYGANGAAESRSVTQAPIGAVNTAAATDAKLAQYSSGKPLSVTA